MSTLVFLPNRNTKRADYSGAFRPEAESFVRHHGLSATCMHELPLAANGEASANAVLEVLRAVSGLETLAFFCHGYPTRIQLGFGLRNVRRLALVLAEVAREDVRVILYACSTARAPGEIASLGGPAGDGGFADGLRDALCGVGLTDCQVDAHTTSGHATRNPYVRRFRGEGSTVGGQGGAWIVRPGSTPLWRAWSAALRSEIGGLRYAFPFMSVAEVHAAVTASVGRVA